MQWLTPHFTTYVSKSTWCNTREYRTEHHIFFLRSSWNSHLSLQSLNCYSYVCYSYVCYSYVCYSYVSIDLASPKGVLERLGLGIGGVSLAPVITYDSTQALHKLYKVSMCKFCSFQHVGIFRAAFSTPDPYSPLVYGLGRV